MEEEAPAAEISKGEAHVVEHKENVLMDTKA